MKEMLWHKHKWPKQVRKSLDYPDEPLFTILDKAAKEAGDKPFTIYGPPKTYAEVHENADRIANFLESKGIKKGDRVGLYLPNTPHYPPIFFGVIKTGAVVVTFNPRYKVDELRHQLIDSGVKVIFVFDHPVLVPRVYETIKGTDVKHVITCSMKSYLSRAKAILGGLLGRIPKSPYYEEEITTSFDDIIANYEPKAPDVKIKPKEDLALVLYTGGTTGVPKGAMLTHHNLLSNITQLNEWVWLEPPDGGEARQLEFQKEVFIGALPWYHSYGLTVTMLMSVYLMSQLVCVPDPTAGKPPYTDLLKTIQKYKGTILNAVPTIYASITYHPNISNFDLSSLKAAGSGAAALAPALAKDFEASTGAVIFEGYGLTETSPLTHINPTNVRDRKFGSIGLPVPDTEVKIIDLETGKKEMKIGEDGEIALAGPQVMKGYWNQPEETKAVMRSIDGIRFFLTGDIGHLDKEGFTIITDRKKDMINVSGLKAWPREIEDTLLEHPKIALSAVIGVPRKDDPSNEYVKAFIQLKPGETATEEEITAWAKEKMAGYKRPTEIEFRDSLPQTAVGKVLRRELREEELAKLGK